MHIKVYFFCFIQNRLYYFLLSYTPFFFNKLQIEPGIWHIQGKSFPIEYICLSIWLIMSKFFQCIFYILDHSHFNSNVSLHVFIPHTWLVPEKIRRSCQMPWNWIYRWLWCILVQVTEPEFFNSSKSCWQLCYSQL